MQGLNRVHRDVARNDNSWYIPKGPGMEFLHAKGAVKYPQGCGPQ
jgi:hypothetical protein